MAQPIPPTPYNYNNDHYNPDDHHNSDDHAPNNQGLIQFMFMLLLLVSCSRVGYECTLYSYNKCITYCNKNRLKCRRLNSSDEDNLLNECPICLEHFCKKDKIIELSCKHNYHEKCIKEWMDNNNNSCPNCRENII